MLRHILLVTAAVFAISHLAIADVPQGGREPAAARERDKSDGDDEYNFSWLDPDKQVYVLQNRKYRKAKKIALFLQGGLNLSNPYRSEWLYGPRVSVWISEQFGFDAFYYGVNSRANDTFTSLEQAASNSGALPFVRRHHSYFGALVSWTPWYAKLNFFNKILYFDWFLNMGLGSTSSSVDRNRSKATPPNFVNENAFTFFFGTGQSYYLSRHWLVRLDFVGSSYNATSVDAQTTRRFTNFDFTAGIGYLF